MLKDWTDAYYSKLNFIRSGIQVLVLVFFSQWIEPFGGVKSISPVLYLLIGEEVYDFVSIIFSELLSAYICALSNFC